MLAAGIGIADRQRLAVRRQKRMGRKIARQSFEPLHCGRRKLVVMNGALEKARSVARNIGDGRGHVVVQIAAEIIEQLLIVLARQQGPLDQDDAIFIVDPHQAPVEPFVENGARAQVARDGGDQLIE